MTRQRERTTTDVRRIATLGAALSANKGSASMLQAVTDRLPDLLGPCHFSVLTTYPDEDRRAATGAGVEIESCRPLQLLAVLPLAVLVAVARRLGRSGRIFCRTPILRTLDDADVVVDIAGISFVDGRGLPILAYNTLMTSVPLLLGRPVVKCSQALGPFHRPLNRLAARQVLPRLQWIGARGPETERHLAELGLTNVGTANDLAFVMKQPAEATAAVERLLAPVPARFVAVSPSEVVAGYCRKEGIDYPGLMAGFIDRLTAGGHHVVLVPHSARPSAPAGRMNDLPLCRAIHTAVARPEHCTLVDAPLGPPELRALIARSETLVTSRFHAMISALATTTPVLVVGWSHKYAEVLRGFDLEDCVIDYRDLSPAQLHERFVTLEARTDDVCRKIDEHLPASVEGAMRNIAEIGAVVGVPAP